MGELEKFRDVFVTLKGIAKMRPKVVPLTNESIAPFLGVMQERSKACHKNVIMKSQQMW